MGQKLKIIKEKLGKSAVTAASYIRVTVKWCVIGVIMGLVCGLIGALFHHAIDFGTELRLEHPWFIFLLPVGGLAIYFVYKWLKLIPDPGTDAIIHASLTGKHVTPKMALGIFFSTIVTQLVGGSGGREGAALQLGGGISGLVSKLSPYKFSLNDDRVLTLCGMSAVFSSLFGTPVTAALFCMEVGRIGSMPYAALAPCIISAYVAKYVALFTGITPTAFTLTAIPKLTPSLMIKLLILGVLCAVIAIIFCESQHLSKKLFEKINIVWLRPLIGSLLVLGMTLLVGSQRYNGAGMSAVRDAIELGMSTDWSFILKILFTAVSLGCGFKGGEIVPAFFTGATFGCLIAPLLGIDPGFAAAVCMVTVFCGVVNCPLASIILAVEVFNSSMLVPITLPVVICYMLSGQSSLYSSQTFVESKLRMPNPNKS